MEDKNRNEINGINGWTDAEKVIAEKLLEKNDSLARDVTEQAKRNAMRWFFVWLITFAALIGTNAAWIYTFKSYEYVSQDGEGQNNINTGSQGDVISGTENEN